MTNTIRFSLTVSLAASLLLAGCGATAEDAGADTASDLAATSGDAPGGAPETVAMVLGDDSSEYANDSECDDPRFVGTAMADGLLTDNIGRDSTDCQAALDAGTASPNPMFATPASDAEINYGDDTSDFANDGECDDIRFTGDYASEMVYIVEDIGHDATDCRNLVNSGDARWQGNSATPERGVTVM